jgi:hypothetical protein
MTAPLPEPEPTPLAAANQRIRDTAKWLVASAAAIGAALIAGSQLSSIGRLELGWPASEATARLWVATAGALVGLTAVVFAITAALRVLLPVQVLITDLADGWEKPGPELRPVVEFFRRRPKFLQGTASPADLIARRTRLVEKLGKDGAPADLRDRIEAMDRRIEAVGTSRVTRLSRQRSSAACGGCWSPRRWRRSGSWRSPGPPTRRPRRSPPICAAPS